MIATPSRTFVRLLPLAAALLSGAVLAQQAPAPAARPASGAAAAPAPQAAASGASPAQVQMAQAARGSADAWLAQVDARDWTKAWESSGALFRTTVPLATWMDGIPKVREPLGQFFARSIAQAVYSREVPGHPPGDYVSFVYNSRYSNRQLQETVTTVREADGRWRVTGYGTR